MQNISRKKENYVSSITQTALFETIEIIYRDRRQGDTIEDGVKGYQLTTPDHRTIMSICDIYKGNSINNNTTRPNNV